MKHKNVFVCLWLTGRHSLSCSASAWHLKSVQRGAPYQMWGAAFFLRSWPASPHLITRVLRQLILCVCASCPQEIQCGDSRGAEGQEGGPAEEEHMPQSSGHQQGAAEPQPRSQPHRGQPGWAHTALPALHRSVSVMCLRSSSTRAYVTERPGKGR